MKAQDLKNSILQLAVQGKLVPQDPSDEPANELLERIREDCAELIEQKKIKKPKGGESVIYRGSDGSRYEKRVDAKGHESEPICIDDEIPFEIPEGWEWARLSSVCVKLTDGSHNPPPKAVNGYPVISAMSIDGRSINLNRISRFADRSGFEKENPRTRIKRGDIILGIIGGSIGNVAIFDYDEAVIAQRSVAIIDCGALNEYVSFALESPLFFGYYKNAAGTAQGGIYLGALGDMLVPIPPLTEQRRIVAKVDELMPLVEEYGELEDAREALDAALPDRLRKSVLQLAVEGKLVPQDPSDEPASELLGRIRKERAKLIEQRKIRRPKGGESVIYRKGGSWYERRGKSEPVCIDDEIPFDIPESWEWCRLCGLAAFSGGKTPSTDDKSNYEENGILWVTSKDMKRDYIDSTLITLSEKGASELTRYKPGTILMVTRSGILRRMLPVAMLKRSATVNQDQKAICPFDYRLSEWLLRFFKASDSYIRSNFSKAGTTVESVVFDKVKSMPIPIPPLEEQKRIVERVDQIMKLIGA